MQQKDHLRSPLGQALGLGSAKHGVMHWWMQRVTAIAMIPLGLWFVCQILCLLGSDRPQVMSAVGSPLNATLLILFIISVFYHAALGIQVVVEDYVHSKTFKTILLMITKLGLSALGVLCVISIVLIALQQFK